MAQAGRNKRNECRNLHYLIHRSGRTLPIPVDSAETPVLVLSGKLSIQKVNFPILLLSQWVRHILDGPLEGALLLGGHRLSEGAEPFRRMFKRFWQRFEQVRPEMDIYQEEGVDLGYCIPYGYHGDEGRGKLKRPIMCLSYQPLVSYRGMNHLNSSGCPQNKLTLEPLKPCPSEPLKLVRVIYIPVHVAHD